MGETESKEGRERSGRKTEKVEEYDVVCWGLLMDVTRMKETLKEEKKNAECERRKKGRKETKVQIAIKKTRGKNEKRVELKLRGRNAERKEKTDIIGVKCWRKEIDGEFSEKKGNRL